MDNTNTDQTEALHDIMTNGPPLTFPNLLDPNIITNHNKKQDTFECIHCNKAFGSKASLNLHLASCKRRAVLRDFVVADRVFHVWMNPRKDLVSALIRIRDNEPEDIVLRLFVGSLTFLTYYGYVHFYLVRAYTPGVTIVKPIKEERKYKEYIDECNIQWKKDESKRLKLRKSNVMPPIVLTL